MTRRSGPRRTRRSHVSIAMRSRPAPRRMRSSSRPSGPSSQPSTSSRCAMSPAATSWSTVGRSSTPPGLWPRASDTGAWLSHALTERRSPGSALVRALEPSDVDLLHLQHRLHDSLGLHRILVTQELPEDRRNDLPGETVPVLQPAALALLAARGELVP